MRSVGRLVDNCPHTSGWDSANGEQRCRACGTRRFTGYGALRPPGLPATLTPPSRDKTQADHSAAYAISRTAVHRRLGRWVLGRAALCPST
ncbi:DUF6255 family natural product biosynthesis protein [Streptomyces olivoreticuli]|uniref:Uncharacterized protein n=1 Tax=Kitasatospora mediocidica TaxID=58352 RepID=A0A2S0X9Y7_9ACTN|nr:hypothetical protein [Kitasatospora mediocidica]